MLATRKAVIDWVYCLCTAKIRSRRHCGWARPASSVRKWRREQLANLYFTGAGVPHSDAEGFRYLRRAAMAGNAQSMRQLGLMLSQGLRITEDVKEGEFWLGKVARLGAPAAAGDAVSFEL